MAYGQTCIPTNCFEIESILVDACGLGTQEGLNELTIFQVGPTALNTSNMTVAWPNAVNTWTGVCQNAGTATKVANINATITGCGRLVEPVGGVLPAGKRVLLFASVNVDETLHSFVNLNDTLIAIFHCGNNVNGNFANTGVGIRTLTISFSVPVGCSDVVSYDRALLPGGNGATLNYCWNGNATYVNNGCTAPYIQLSTNAGIPQSVCEGTTINVSGSVSSCTHCFQWYGGAGTFGNPNALSTTYTPAPGETGTVNLFLGQFTSCDTAFSTLTVAFNPPPVYSLGPDTAICGNFSMTLNPGIPGQNYAWSTGAVSQSITVTTPGTYSLTLTTTGGCVVADTIVISSTTLNDLGFPPNDTICPGGSFLLSPTVAGATYNWSTGASSPSITISNPGTYSLTLTTATGCVGTDTFLLSNHPATIVNLGNDTILCPGNSLTLDADPLGNYPGATYNWSTGASTQTITTGAAGTYSVTVTSAQNCIGIDSIQVTVSSNIPVNIGADTAICAGQSLVLNAGSGQSYVWSTGATTQTITVTTTGSYAVTVTFGVGCQNEDTIAVTVNPNPTVNLGNDTLYCANQGLTLDAGPGNTYAWSTGATTQTLTLSTGGTYSVTVTNAFNCTAVDSIVVATGVVPQVNLGPNTQLCPGQSITLDAGTQATTYLWSTGATTQTINVNTAGTYWAVVTTNCGTDSSATTITYYPVASVEAGPNDTLCAGASLTFAGSQATNGTLLWTTTSGSFNDPTLLHPTFTAGSTGGLQTFHLTLTDSCGTYTDSLTLLIIPPLSMTITLPDSVCYGQSVQISYTGNPDSVLWVGQGTFSDSTGNPTVYTPAPGQVGNIPIVAVAYGQCGSQVFTTSYFGQDILNANFGWTPGEIYPGTHVYFTNGSTPPGLPTHWAFGDSFYSVESDPMHRYYTSGTYDVELIVYGVDGCTDTLTLTLNVLPTDTIIPNVFSPNGDGINDVFNFRVPPTESFSLAIFDRWGKQLYYSLNPEEKWDGTTKGGSDVPEGVYYYVMRMKLLAGTVLIYNGPLTLLR